MGNITKHRVKNVKSSQFYVRASYFCCFASFYSAKVSQSVDPVFVTEINITKTNSCIPLLFTALLDIQISHQKHCLRISISYNIYVTQCLLVAQFLLALFLFAGLLMFFFSISVNSGRVEVNKNVYTTRQPTAYNCLVFVLKFSA